MLRKSLAAGAALLLVGAATALGFFWPFGGGGDRLETHGVVEIQEVRLGSKVGGRVAEVLVREGERVKPGQELIRFEVPELLAQQKQWQAKLRAARAELERVQSAVPREVDAAGAAEAAARAKLDRANKGWREEEVRMAKFELETVDAELKNLSKDLARTAQLLTTNASARADYDDALARRDQALARREAAKAKYEMFRKGSREEDVRLAQAELEQARANYLKLYNTQHEQVELARASVAELEAKLEEIQANVDERTVVAPENAAVEVVGVRKGDLVAPNQPVVRVLRADDLWVKAFIPETQYGKVRLGQKVQVYLDTYPDRAFEGVVFQKGDVSEFTPRNVQSVDERRYQVFPVKIRVDDPDGVLNSGMAARVVIRQ